MRIAILALAVAAGTLAGCEGEAPRTAGATQPRIEGETVVFAPDSPQTRALVLEPATPADIVAHNLPGRLVWNEDRTVRVYSPFAGRVTRILAQPGERVRAGQPLAEIASPDFGQAQTEARRAATDLALAERSVQRARELAAGGVVAQKDLQAAEAEHARADAEMARARARVRLYGGGEGIDQTYVLRAPLAGQVVERSVNPGQEVRPDQMVAAGPALFVITDPTRLWVLLDAREKDLGYLGRGQEVLLRSTAFPLEKFAGRIDQIADFVDPLARTVKVRGSLDNDGRRLKAEMYVTAAVRSDAAPGVAVSARAVFIQADRHYAFVESAPGRYERRLLDVGEEDSGRMAVLSGIRPGDRVVIDGALLLQQLLQSRTGS